MKSIKSKLIAYISIALLLSCSLIGVFSIMESSKSILGVIDNMSTDKVYGDMEAAHVYIEKHHGKISLKDGELYDAKGIQVRDNFEMVDAAGKDLGDKVTIFVKKGDDFERVSTNVVDEQGGRAVGTSLGSDSAAYQKVMSGETYVGECQILGKEHIAAYDPIKDSSGQVIGLLFVGVPKDEILELANGFSAQLMWKIIMLSLLAIAAGIIAAVFIGNSITRPIGALSAQIEDGDYTKDVPDSFLRREDELGKFAGAIDKMQKEVRNLMYEVRDTSKELLLSSNDLAAMSKQSSSTTNEIAQAMDQIAASTSSQAENLENSVSSVNDLSVKIDVVAQAIEHMGDMSAQMDSLNSTGVETMQVLLEKAADTKDSVVQADETVTKINAVAEKIGAITEAINAIADQTNLLALNASIEAARAGEHGRGFAVVAEEIRKLAEQSSHEAENIKNLIENVQAQARNAAEAMEHTAESLKEQDVSVAETEKIFQAISGSIESIREQVGRIDTETREMENSKNVIVDMVENIAAMAQEASASTQEVSAAAEEQLAASEQVTASANRTRELAVNLQKELAKFNIE